MGDQGVESGELLQYSRVGLSAGAMHWNANPIDPAALPGLLAQAAAITPSPVTVFVASGDADCAAILAIRKQMNGVLHCSAERIYVEYSDAEWADRYPPVPACDADCQAYGNRAGG